MNTQFYLYCYNKLGSRIGQFGPVGYPDRRTALNSARMVFAQQLRNNPGSYIDAVEV